MVALSPEAAVPAAEDRDPRWRIGVGLAVVWVVAQLWNASPLPHGLVQAFEIHLYLDGPASGWVHLAFGSAATFLLFPGRFARSLAMNLVLAALAAMIFLYPLWVPLLELSRGVNMETLRREALPLDFAMVALALLLLVIMATRVFGRFAGILAAVALLPPGLVSHLRDGTVLVETGILGFLEYHHFARQELGALYVEFSSIFVFVVAFLGVGLDHMGWGRRLAAASAGFLSRFNGVEVCRVPNALAARIFAVSSVLGIILYVFGEFVRAGLSMAETMALLVAAVGLYASCIFASLGLGRRYEGATAATDQPALRGLRIALGATHFLALVAVVTAIAFGVLGQGLEILRALSGGRLLGLDSALAALTFFALGCLVVVAAIFFGPVRGRWPLVLFLVGLPLVTLNWMMVDGLSPASSAFWASIVVLLCILAWRIAGAAEDNRTRLHAIACYMNQDLVVLCVSTARFMAGCAVLAALFWPAMNWWYSLNNYLIP